MSAVPPPPAQDRRHRKHSTRTIALARTLYGDGDSWTPTQIRRYLADRGITASESTIRRWVIPAEAKGHREMNARVQRQRRARARGELTETPLLDRMRVLREAGLSLSSIGVVLGVDEGVRLSPEQARYYLRAGREPVLPARKAAA